MLPNDSAAKTTRMAAFNVPTLFLKPLNVFSHLPSALTQRRSRDQMYPANVFANVYSSFRLG
jgi:hypothetical protein